MEEGGGVVGRIMGEVEAGVDPDVVLKEKEKEKKEKEKVINKGTVAVFFLDCRSNKTPWSRGPPTYGFGPHVGDFFGEKQWAWFSEALKNSNAEVNIIVNGLQVLALNRSQNGNHAEDWDKFPEARKRLLETVLTSGVNAPMLVSGDVHMAQLMRVDCKKGTERRSLVEVTTSGLTHSWGTGFSPYPRHRTKMMVPFIKASGWIMHFFHHLMPWNELMDSNENGKENAGENGKETTTFPNGGGVEGGEGLQYSLELNYGSFEFDFEKDVVYAKIKTTGGRDVLLASWEFEALNGLIEGGSPQWGEGEGEGEGGEEWNCEPYRGKIHAWKVVVGYVVGLSVLFGVFMIVPGCWGGVVVWGVWRLLRCGFWVAVDIFCVKKNNKKKLA